LSIRVARFSGIHFSFDPVGFDVGLFFIIVAMWPCSYLTVNTVSLSVLTAIFQVNWVSRCLLKQRMMEVN